VDPNFEWAIRAEFATQHEMHERGIDGPVELNIGLGYDMQIHDPKKWDDIQKTYELEIKRCLKEGMGNRRGFKFKKLIVAGL